MQERRHKVRTRRPSMRLALGARPARRHLILGPSREHHPALGLGGRLLGALRRQRSRTQLPRLASTLDRIVARGCESLRRQR